MFFIASARVRQLDLVLESELLQPIKTGASTQV